MLARLLRAFALLPGPPSNAVLTIAVMRPHHLPSGREWIGLATAASALVVFVGILVRVVDEDLAELVPILEEAT